MAETVNERLFRALNDTRRTIRGRMSRIAPGGPEGRIPPIPPEEFGGDFHGPHPDRYRDERHGRSHGDEDHGEGHERHHGRDHEREDERYYRGCPEGPRPMPPMPPMPPMGPMGPERPGDPHGRDGFHRPPLARERILEVISDHGEGIHQKDIAKELGVNASSVSEFIDRLEDGGYILRTVDPSDRRATLISLTPKGEARACELKDEREAQLGALFSGLTDEEKKTLITLLEKLNSPAEERKE